MVEKGIRKNVLLSFYKHTNNIFLIMFLYGKIKAYSLKFTYYIFIY